MWLVAQNRCWTPIRLAKRNLPHPTLCVLCNQEKETINYFLIGCVFARQFWFYFLQRLGNSILTPQPGVRDENGRKKSRPDLYRFLHLTRPFPYLRKNMETGQKRERAYSVRFCGIPFFRIEPVFIPYLTNMRRA
jgi:hypothetical protein